MDTSHLPQSDEAYRTHLTAAEAVDWSDRNQAIASMVEESRIIAGTTHPFEEAWIREFVARDFDRTGATRAPCTSAGRGVRSGKTGFRR
jgi:hypothetical protein